MKKVTEKNELLVIYSFLLVGLFLVAPILLVFLWLVFYSKNNSSFKNYHYKYIKKIMVLGTCAFLVSAVLSYFIIGYFLIFFVWFWALYKVFKGMFHTIWPPKIATKCTDMSLITHEVANNEY